MSSGRTASAVCDEATRPTSAEDVEAVRNAIKYWPIYTAEKETVKRILNITDCRMGVDVTDGVILAESLNDGIMIIFDIEKDDNDWVRIPWG